MGIFDEVQGLPWHPLVVHVVVVLIPLSLIGLMLIIFIPRWRRPGQWFVLAALAVGSVGAYVAKLSGDSLSAAVGLPVFHAEWGNNLLPLLAVLLAVVGAWIWLDHLSGRKVLERVTAGLAIVLSVGALGLTYIVGHSGAEAVWARTFEEARQPPATAGQGELTMAQVAARSTPDDCWTVVNGQVYDLTDFIARHPAGAGPVIDMCGKDASESFNGAHEGQAEPEGWLEVFAIGVLRQ